ncbi:MAG: TetR family transcriptional regulator, partial [Comamonadaceae bacterium]
MDDSQTKPALVRDIARDAVRAHVTAVAVNLFDKLGFDNVTIDQLSEAAGISRRTFHRYFSAKEDVIVGDTAQTGTL